jgi:predicted DNA binding CopG/RHH family protein
MLDIKALQEEKIALEEMIVSLNAKNATITDLINNADKYNKETLAKINTELEVKEAEITDRISEGKIAIIAKEEVSDDTLPENLIVTK